MTIHRPGLPEDLPPGEVLWGRWALLAALGATVDEEGRLGFRRTGRWIDASGLNHDDSGCTWWVMSRRGEGRFVLYGEDESSGVKWHRPPIDMLAGGPHWLPYEELRDRLEGYELGCVYWYEHGSWARAPYPDSLGDDGLDCGMSDFVDRACLLRELGLYIDGTVGTPGADGLLADAEAGRLAPALLSGGLRRTGPDGDPLDLRAITGALALAGLTG
ncbi:hypothetical protein ACHBTE_22935 [Streptomyces sp. M41]|uniref:hypothetical protein n=1 Tax=Streptomyces sp. M41 TaxID=3059412 RepID=UPI00374CFF52